MGIPPCLYTTAEVQPSQRRARHRRWSGLPCTPYRCAKGTRPHVHTRDVHKEATRRLVAQASATGNHSGCTWRLSVHQPPTARRMRKNALDKSTHVSVSPGNRSPAQRGGILHWVKASPARTLVNAWWATWATLPCTGRCFHAASASTCNKRRRAAAGEENHKCSVQFYPAFKRKE